MGKLIRWAIDDEMPFALEVWLGDNAVTFIGKHLLSHTNEAGEEKGKNNQEDKQIDAEFKPS